MGLMTLQECLDFIGIEGDYFIVNADNDCLNLKLNSGLFVSVDIPDGTYSPSDMVTALQSAINTALTATTVVTWSTSTRKFTIDAGLGNTLTYLHTDSDAGFLIGFNQSHSASRTLTSDVSCASPAAKVEQVRQGVESAIKNYCGKDFAETTYKEYYDGKGISEIFLNHYPISSVQMLAIGSIDAIRIWNTSQYTTAFVEVISTGIILTKDGSAVSLLFADYTTMGALVSAVVATGDGWNAELIWDAYGNFASSLLMERFGACTIDSNQVYLKIPDRARSSFTVQKNQGIITLPTAVPVGTSNVYIEYTAYSGGGSEDVKLAGLMWVRYLYQRIESEGIGVDHFSLGDISTYYERSVIPSDARAILDSYVSAGVLV